MEGDKTNHVTKPLQLYSHGFERVCLRPSLGTGRNIVNYIPIRLAINPHQFTTHGQFIVIDEGWLSPLIEKYSQLHCGTEGHGHFFHTKYMLCKVVGKHICTSVAQFDDHGSFERILQMNCLYAYK